LLTALIFSPSILFAKDLPLLKVGLSRALGGDNTLIISNQAAMLITQASNGKLVLRTGDNGVYRLTSCSTGIELTRLNGNDEDTVGCFPYPLSFASVDDSQAGAPSGNTRGLSITKVGSGGQANSVPHRYRGALTIRKRPDGLLSVIDVVNVEDYLYGVIGPEMGSSAPPEALKAQAVAARTYALRNRGRFADEGFDIDDSTRSQQYEGVDAETASTITAVDATRGQVLTFDGKLIDAYYSTDCGGITAVDSTGDHPYFKAVAESPGDGRPDYDATSNYRDWDCNFAQSDLVKLLDKDARTRVSTFACLTLDALDESGRIKTATVSDVDGTMKTVTGPELRQILGYDTLKSTRVTLTVKSDGEYVFHGHGWGHGFGMSQDGAIGMASAPYNKTYTDILAHYYVGTKLVDDSDVME
jgi:stage II sporulation protein D